MKRLLLSLLMLISASASADALKGVYPPDIAGRDADGNCLYDGPVLLDLKIDAGTWIQAFLVDTNGITYPMGWNWLSLDKFKGVWGFDFPTAGLNGQEWLLVLNIFSPEKMLVQITTDDYVMAFSCPFHVP